MSSIKVQEHHRQRPAYIYIRQSTMGQVRHHQESTQRQYALRDKALQMSWEPDAIRILDRDLGQSGAQSTDREDFKTLVADVSMGRVGAIFALEASRLARSNLDWHRLIEICAFTKTLVIDEDGCYDPADFNDALLLGLKATIAQAELHFIRARLWGGKLNKAKKGELRFPVPVGFCHDEDGRIILDPDQEVQGAVRLAFNVFRETGSAYGVVQHFAQKGLRFPKRSYGGAWDGKLIWGHPNHGRVLGLLKNPSYAGVYSFGRYRSSKAISSSGEIRTKTAVVPMDSWHVAIHDHHPGYITWKDYEKNQVLLEKNRTNGEEHVLSGAAREGLALLQGLLLCGTCGRRISVRYQGNGGIYPTYDCTALRRDGLSTTSCMSIRCDILDTAVSKRALEVLKPAQIEVACEAMRQLEIRDEAISTQWRMRIERAEYEVQLSERRYQEVDPSNRLVAATLEKRWNDALKEAEKIRAQRDEIARKEALTITAEQRAKISALAEDFPRLWSAPSTKAKDKKRLLRLLIKDVTVKRSGPKIVSLGIRWQGGALEEIEVARPQSVIEQVRYRADVIDRVRDLARSLPDDQIAQRLNDEGVRPSKGVAFNVSIVRWIRFKHEIPPIDLKRPDELTVKQVANNFGVRPGVVYYWIEHGIISVRRRNCGSPCWITLSSEKEEELRAWIQNSARIQKHAKQPEGVL